jgi:serine/threonine-protein kinase
VLTIGQTLRDRYEIEAVLGEGGMGRVYRARHQQRGLTVAIKEIACPDEAAQRSVRAEAETLSRLSHPNLPKVYDFLQQDDYCYIVMELVRGVPLHEHLAREQQRPSEATVLDWARQLCAVLRYLHGHKPPVIFKDLKPANIMLSEDGRLKLVDFGISKVMETPDDVTRTIAKGAISPGFAPPEQYSGGTDVRSDIYALGATLYTLACGVRPPDSVDIAARVQMPVPMRDLNPDIAERTAAIFAWTMQISPSDRPQTIDEVIDAFAGKRWAPSQSGQRQTTAGQSTARPADGKAAVAGVALLAMMVLGVVSWRHQGRASAPAAALPAAVSGRLKIDTVPAAAHAEVDGKMVGVTPFESDVSEGIHHVRLTLEHYESVDKAINIKRGVTIQCDPERAAESHHHRRPAESRHGEARRQRGRDGRRQPSHAIERFSRHPRRKLGLPPLQWGHDRGAVDRRPDLSVEPGSASHQRRGPSAAASEDDGHQHGAGLDPGGGLDDGAAPADGCARRRGGRADPTEPAIRARARCGGRRHPPWRCVRRRAAAVPRRAVRTVEDQPAYFLHDTGGRDAKRKR